MDCRVGRLKLVYTLNGIGRTADFEQILDSLGIGQDVWREANHMLEIRFWVSVFLLI
jgi:hypothetical protein